MRSITLGGKPAERLHVVTAITTLPVLLTPPLLNETVLTLPTFVFGSCYQAAWHQPPATPQQTLSQAVSNVSSPGLCDFLPRLPLGGPVRSRPTVHLKGWVMGGGARRGCDEWENCQCFVHSCGYHFNVFAEMEFEFQKV
ncbi:hypothetical protein mRhiFer1_009919 [Rhinolophus ferrumequinum]|uniref:Uncharacterized protein n=1 Tax=Rhinolophus ferrumequinum TaxID=59479 RepID=A0A7J7YI98_RHIFE|nr:hypothetical protein mRhiFer1_009919 [Rhinolophus ferrumequinum]